MTYLDAISAISVIYAKKGYVTERDISFVMVKYNVPRSKIGIIYDILNNFSLDIREKDLEAVSADLVSITESRITMLEDSHTDMAWDI